MDPSHVTGRSGCAIQRLAVDALLFDTAGVLYDATYWPRRLVRLINGLGLNVHYDEFVFRWEREFLHEVHRGRREYDEAFQSFLLSLGLSWAQIDEVDAVGRSELQDFRRALRPLPGVVPTISRLRHSGVSMVAWADSPDPVAATVERMDLLGLAGMFRQVLSSFDLEAAQPDAACYRAGLEALGQPADRAAYVGHDAVHLAAAKEAGFHTIAYNYQSGTSADYYLTQFNDLLSLLAGRGGAASA
jgi:HAD superfamily hydrolase (TIGR01509 family)